MNIVEGKSQGEKFEGAERGPGPHFPFTHGVVSNTFLPCSETQAFSSTGAGHQAGSQGTCIQGF